MVALYHNDRAVFKLIGPDTVSFLQGITTNDIETLAEKEILYTVMLTSTGRFHFEFFLYKDPKEENTIYLDTPSSFSKDLFKRLNMFKLRSKIHIEDVSSEVTVVTYHGEQPSEPLCFEDPRHINMGYRGLVLGDLSDNFKYDRAFYISLCLKNCIPRAGFELIPEKTIPLEANLEELHAISFTKGCYIGQELTARTKHQGMVRKKLYSVVVEGDLTVDDLEKGVVIHVNGNKVGVLLSYQDGVGIAKLRIENVETFQNFAVSVNPIKTPSMNIVSCELINHF